MARKRTGGAAPSEGLVDGSFLAPSEYARASKVHYVIEFTEEQLAELLAVFGKRMLEGIEEGIGPCPRDVAVVRRAVGNTRCDIERIARDAVHAVMRLRR